MTEPSMDWKQRAISITGDGTVARIVLDDIDISRHVTGYTIEHRAGQPPLVVLFAHPNAGAAFDGMAHVAIGDQADPGPAITAFLSNIDASALESAALQREDLGGGKGEVTRAILAQLADWAQGRA